MSAATNQPQLPDLDTSMELAIEGIHKRAFLYKLAQLGHFPATNEEADALVELGFKLASIPMPPAQKQASVGPYAAASQALDSVLGLDKQAAADEAGEIAFMMAQDPALYSAALVIKHAQAQAARAA